MKPQLTLMNDNNTRKILINSLFKQYPASLLSIAFGLLGNKGMHAYNGNMSSYSDDSEDWSSYETYNTSYSSSDSEELERELEAFAKQHCASKPQKVTFVPPANGDKHWVEAVSRILNPPPGCWGIEELVEENTKLRQALAWSVTEHLACAQAPSFQSTKEAVESCCLKIAGDLSKYPYVNWDRCMHLLADQIHSFLGRKNWLHKASYNPYLQQVPKAKLEITPASTPKPQVVRVNKLLSNKVFAIKCCPLRRRRQGEYAKCSALALTQPSTTYVWWQRAQPCSNVGLIVLGLHKTHCASLHTSVLSSLDSTLSTSGKEGSMATKVPPKVTALKTKDVIGEIHHSAGLTSSRAIPLNVRSTSRTEIFRALVLPSQTSHSRFGRWELHFPMTKGSLDAPLLMVIRGQNKSLARAGDD